MDGITMPLNDKLVVKFAFEHDLKNIVLALDSVKTSDNFTFSSPLAYNAIPDLLQLRSSVFELGKIYFYSWMTRKLSVELQNLKHLRYPDI